MIHFACLKCGGETTLAQCYSKRGATYRRYQCVACGATYRTVARTNKRSRRNDTESAPIALKPPATLGWPEITGTWKTAGLPKDAFA